MREPISHTTLFQISPNPYMVLDRHLVYREVNDAYLRVTGRTREELIGKHIFDVFPGNPLDPADTSVAQLRQSFEYVLREGRTHHLALIRYAIPVESPIGPVFEDRYWSATHVPVFGEDGQVEAILQHTVDVTELQELKKALRASQLQRDLQIEGGVFERARQVEADNRILDAQLRSLRRLFEQAPGFIAFLSGPLHVFEFVNRAYYELIGSRDILGKPVREALPEIAGQGFFELLDRVYESAEPYVGRRVPVRVRRAPGEPPVPRYVDFVFQPVLEADGSVSGVFVQGQDLTEQHRAEEEMQRYRTELERLLSERTQALARSQAEHAQTRAQLEHVQRLEALGRLTGGIAHDFNNLLQVLNNCLMLLRHLVGHEPEAQRWITTASNAVANGAKLTGQLLAFARRQPLEPRPINVGSLVRGMEDLLRRTLGGAIEVDTRIADNLWIASADPARLENVILNLAINARDAMDGQGRLTIEVGNVHLDASYAARHHDVQPGDYVLLSVADTGCGMTPEVMERVFEPFFSTKPAGQGTGLGLSMVYGFVKQSGGHVTLQSAPGAGTTVQLFLPRSDEAEQRPEVQWAGPVEGGHETILVVEDDPAVLATTVETLADLGYQVLHACDAQQGLEAVRTRPDIALIFTDVVMPGRLRTTELAEQAQRLRPGLKVLYTSGYTEDAIVRDGILRPGVQLLPKPYSRDELARRVRQMLGAAAPGPTAPPAEPPRAAPLRVLFVEDDEDLRTLAAEMLRLLGHEVQACARASEALEGLARARFDVLLTDVALPDMSGLELARIARARHPALRVVLASGYGRSALPDEEAADARTVLLPKPYSSEGLQQALRYAVGRAAG